MSEKLLVTTVRTNKGDLPIDYNALENLPKFDAAWKAEHGVADAAAIQSAIDSNNTVINLKISGVESIARNNIQSISTLRSDMESGYVSNARLANLTPEAIGAAKSDLSNIDDGALKSAMESSGVGGIPVVEALSSDGSLYTATVPGVTALTNGMLLTIIPQINSTTKTPVFEINNLGSKMLRRASSVTTAAISSYRSDFYFTAGHPVTLQYDAEYQDGTGVWKMLGNTQPAAADLVGVVPIENGGTGALTAEKARENLGITLENLGDIIVVDSVPDTITNGMWYLVKVAE